MNQPARSVLARKSNKPRNRPLHRRLAVESLEERRLLTVVSLIPAKDNSIYSGFVNNSNGMGDLYTGLNNDLNNIKRALLNFNVAGAVPAGATINSVTLGMYVVRNNNGGNSTVELHKLLADWGEAASMAGTYAKNGGQGTAAQPNDATWLASFYNTTAWATPGGSFSPTISGSTVVLGPNGTGAYTWASTSQMVADVQNWLNNPGTNFGWLLKGSAADELVNTSHAYYPREWTTAAQRPTLTINYTVSATNQPPTLNAIANPAAINENAGLQTVSLAGITAGTGDTQQLQVTAASDNTALIPNPTVSYTSPAATGSISYTPVASKYGTAHVTVTVRDAGLDGTLGNADDAAFARTFSVVVNQVNEAPTLDAILDPAAINENAGLQTVNLAGITAGTGDTQQLQVTAASDNTALIPNPTVSYTSPAATGSISYTPVASKYGTAHVTVTVRDAGLDGTLGNADDATFARTFTVVVNQVNQAPTLNAIPDPAAINENAGLQTVNLAGITAGPGDTQQLQVTAASDNTALIPDPTVSYTSPGAIGSISYQPVASQHGTAHVTVTVRDAGLDGTLGNADDGSFVRTFTVLVNQVMTVTLSPVQDNTLIKDTSTTLGSTSNGTGDVYVGRNTSGTVTQRGVLAFDMGAIPAGATIQSVTLSMYVSKTQAGDTGIGLYHLLADWGEAGSFGSGGNGAAAQTGDATWLNTFYNTQFWATPGGDFSPTASAVQTVGAQGAYSTWNSTAEMVADVQGWLDNPGTNFGWLLKGDETQQSSKQLASRESVNAAQRPLLTISYAINRVPTLAAIPDPAAIEENAGVQTVNLAGITAGPGDAQQLQVTAASDNTALIPNPTVSYTSPGATGSLSYQPVAYKYGTAHITVTVRDAGLDGILGNTDDGSFARIFSVVVNEVNQSPTLAAIPDPAAIRENAGLQTVSLTGITAGQGDTQQLQITATSDNTALIPDPTVSYTSPGATGSISYQPVALQYGTAHVTVTVRDAGLDGILGNADDATFAQTFSVVVMDYGAPDTPCLYDGLTATFQMRGSNSAGMADYSFGYGAPNSDWVPLVGDWNGDGNDTVGSYDPATSIFYLRDSLSSGYADVTLGFGAPGKGWIPLVGDWDGDGTDTVGCYDPATSVFYLRNSLTSGNADVVFGFGSPGAGWKPLVGDWDGNGTDTIGCYDAQGSIFYLRNSNDTSFADLAFGFGMPLHSNEPIAGDWDGSGTDSVGLYDPNTSMFYMANNNAAGYADYTFGYGSPGAGWTPMAGAWNAAAGASMQAADGVASGAPGAPLVQAELAPIVNEAFARWAAAGIPPQGLATMQQARFTIADLGGPDLGVTRGHSILLDRDIDPRAIDRMDLFTVVEHELGHVAGLDDLDFPTSSLMGSQLQAGERRLAGAAEADAILANEAWL